jgi:hypothetical protein
LTGGGGLLSYPFASGREEPEEARQGPRGQRELDPRVLGPLAKPGRLLQAILRKKGLPER